MNPFRDDKYSYDGLAQGHSVNMCCQQPLVCFGESVGGNLWKPSYHSLGNVENYWENSDLKNREEAR